jgi:phosphatidylserine/phosphatidylglycerophosphate/cardiolipin synthase-like enzyme
MKTSAAIVSMFICATTHAATFPANTSYDVCFTPSYQCSKLIIHAITQAKHDIRVQAYSFTLESIESALVDAHMRGVDVQVILDKTQENTSAVYFREHGIPVWIDYRPRIAHNKIMIIDEATVITGSFNFTRSAQERNAENVLMIHDATLAQRYLDNWYTRKELSR